MNYKKIILLLMLSMIFVFASCENKTTDSSPKMYFSTENEELNLNSLKDEASYSGNIIQDEITAEKYADVIFTHTLQKKINDYKVKHINFYPKNNIWVVSYGIDENTIGGDTNIVLSASTGEVLKIWFGE